MIPPSVQRLLNIEDRLKATVETIDLKDQLFVDGRTGKPSAAPFHAHGQIQVVSYWYNMAKGGGYALTIEYQLLALTLCLTGHDEPATFDTIAQLIRRFERVEQEYQIEAVRPTGTRSRFAERSERTTLDVIRAADRFEKCFGAEATSVMPRTELRLFESPPANVAAYLRRRWKSSEPPDLAYSVATAENRQGVLNVLNGLE